MDYTRQQEEAIRLRNEDILVSAGAGAGKTRVLITRIADMMISDEPPVPAEHFLVITFTNAAASEMKERLIGELGRRRDSDPKNEWIRRQIRMAAQADITTIHSFCSGLIRRHSSELGLDPAFRIGEDGERILLARETMEELMEESYVLGGEDFVRFVEAYAPGKSDDRIADLIENLYTFTRAFPDSAGWLEECMSLDETGARLNRVFKDCHKRTSSYRSRIESLGKRAAADSAPSRCCAIIRSLSEIMGKLEERETFDGFREELFGISWPQLRVGKEGKAWSGYPELSRIHTVLKNEIKRWKEGLFAASEKEVLAEEEELAPFRNELIRLVLRYEELHLEKKREKNVYDYDDLEHFALRLLVEDYDEEGNPVPTKTAEELARRYRMIFVDEYQDVNLIQETLVEAVHRPGANCVFMVGDVKQSIYGFRQARPDLFLRRSHRYAGSDKGKEIRLLHNFRSSSSVIEAVNFFFRRLMSEEFGGVSYDKDTTLVAGRGETDREAGGRTKSLLFVKDDYWNTLKKQESLPSDLEVETAMIAEEIRRLKDEGYALSEMVILLRSAKSRGEEMAGILNGLGIPAVSGSKTGYFDTREISVMMNLLSIIDNVYQDIPMASVLLSSIGGFDEEELMKLTISVDPAVRESIHLYDMLEYYEKEGEEEDLRRKTEDFLRMLKTYRERKKEVSLSDLLWDIYQETGFYYHVALLPGGEERRQNLLMLLKKAEDYEKTVYRGLFYFVRYMRQLKTYEQEPVSPAVSQKKEEAVQIMTIHGSKGLEFPVVFVSRLGGRFNFRELSEEAVFHPQIGIGLELRDLKSRLSRSSFLKKVIADRLKKDALEEELRILYVAMTRARERLILSGVVTEKKYLETGTDVEAEDRIRAGSCMDWILPCLKNAQETEEEGWLSQCLCHWGDLNPLFGENVSEIRQEMPRDRILAEYASEEGADAVERAFSYVYPYRRETGLKRKYSVSELKKLGQTPVPDEEEEAVPVYEKEEEIPRPAFLSAEPDQLSASGRGTIVHKVLELLSFAEITDEDSLDAGLSEIEGRYPPARDVAPSYLREGISRFLFSEEGELLRQADRKGCLFKEAPFTIGLAAKDLYPDTESEEMVVVQGVIDLYCRTEEGLWLLDYKTDRILPGQEDVLLDRYRNQMLYYKTALERITEKSVVRIDIYSFSLGRFVPVCFDSEVSYGSL